MCKHGVYKERQDPKETKVEGRNKKLPTLLTSLNQYNHNLNVKEGFDA